MSSEQLNFNLCVCVCVCMCVFNCGVQGEQFYIIFGELKRTASSATRRLVQHAMRRLQGPSLALHVQ